MTEFEKACRMRLAAIRLALAKKKISLRDAQIHAKAIEALIRAAKV